MQEDKKDKGANGNSKRQVLRHVERLGALRGGREDLVAQLTHEGKDLRTRLHSQGELLARVTAALDSESADDSRSRRIDPLAGTRFAAPTQRTGRMRRLIPALPEGLGLLAAGLLLLVCSPHVGRWFEPQAQPVAEEAQPIELALLTASRLERLYPAQLLQALSTPLTKLAQAEGQEVQRDLRRVVQGFSQQLPAFLR